LSKVLKIRATEADPFLMPALFRKGVEGRSGGFKKIMGAVGIPLTKVDLPYAKVRQYAQCLYALRKTFNIWQYGMSTKLERQLRMNHASAKAHRHYEDDLDPYVIQQELRLFNLAPRIV
jgi:hypothetical protein